MRVIGRVYHVISEAYQSTARSRIILVFDLFKSVFMVAQVPLGSFLKLSNLVE